MTNRDIEDMKNRIDELEEMIKIKSDENELLNKKIKLLNRRTNAWKIFLKVLEEQNARKMQ